MVGFRLVLATRTQQPAGVFCFLTKAGALPVIDAAGCLALKDSGLFALYPAFETYMSSTRSDPTVLLVSSGSLPEVSDVLGRVLGAADDDQKGSLSFQPFALAARGLVSGADRNALQLAVQFLSTDGLDDSLVAAEYDWDFLQKVRADLEKKKP